MEKREISTFWLVIGCVILTPTWAAIKSHETRLFETLRQGYLTEVRPVLNTSESLLVEISMKLFRLDELSTKDQYISVVGWVSTHWTDYRLQWEPEDYGGLDVITMLPTQVWLPTYVLSNPAASGFYKDIWYNLFKVKVKYDGTLYWAPGGQITAECSIDIHLFPFDDQICRFRFENWVYTADKVNLSYTDTAQQEVLSHFPGDNGQWDIIDTKVTRIDIMYTSSPHPFANVNFGVHLKRKSLFYVTNIILLSLLLAVLVLFMFKLPAESGERISMGVTLLLSFSVFILMINDSIPETSTAVPVIIVYLVCFMAVTTFGICESVLALYCFHHTGRSQPPQWLMKLLPFKQDKPSKKEQFYKIPSTNNNKQQEAMADQQEGKVVTVSEEILDQYGSAWQHVVMTEEPPSDRHVSEWKAMSRALDVCCFWSCVACFVILMLVLLIIMPFTASLKDIEEYSKKW